MRPKSFSAFTDELFLAILDAEERTGKSNVNIIAACSVANLEWDDERLTRFLNEQRNITGNGMGVLDMYTFEMNPAGRELAEKLRRDRLPKTIIQRLTGDTSQKLINVLNFGVALLALVVAAIALVKN